MLTSWQEFLLGKRKRKDVIFFGLNLTNNLLYLHFDLKNYKYQHGGYQAFKITDPKVRDIHKASVRDRLVHHAIYRILYPYFDRKFIFDSYSCRIGRGTHRAINRFRNFAYIVSRNQIRTAWVLKCDVKKFFASIDHRTLLNILSQHISDQNVLRLLRQIIDSFYTKGKSKVGLPLGNLTSQLLINIYMNEFDHFMKRELRVNFYIRYADDFVVLSDNKFYLQDLLPKINEYLKDQLKLTLHQDKTFIKTFASGIDYLGWVHFSDHRILRGSTKRRMLDRIAFNLSYKTYQSYSGLIKHGNTFQISQALNNFGYQHKK